MNKWIYQLAFCCFVSPCLADGTEAEQKKTQEPPVIVHTGWRALTPEEIANLPELIVPNSSPEVLSLALDTVIELYAHNPENQTDIATYPKPLIAYLDNLQKSIKKKQDELDVLDAKIASGEKHSPDLSQIRAKMSKDVFFDKELYKELKSYLDNALEGSELKPPNE